MCYYQGTGDSWLMAHGSRLIADSWASALSRRPTRQRLAPREPRRDPRVGLERQLRLRRGLRVGKARDVGYRGPAECQPVVALQAALQRVQRDAAQRLPLLQVTRCPAALAHAAARVLQAELYLVTGERQRLHHLCHSGRIARQPLLAA